jgi:hypothetical protein
MAQSARDELQFMRAEADERTKAYVRVPDIRANLDGSLDVSGWLDAYNVGPSNAYQVRCFAWYVLPEVGGETGEGRPAGDDPVMIERGDQKRLQFTLKLSDEALRRVARPPETAVNDPAWLKRREEIIKSPKEMWVLLAWTDEADRLWAHCIQMVGSKASNAFEVGARWPLCTDRGARLQEGDPLLRLLGQGSDARKLLDEVKRRLAD